MSTEEIEEQSTEQVEEVEQTEYVPPAVSISRTTTIGEHTDSLRIELARVQDYPSTGDLAVVVETVLHALAGQREPEPKPELTVSVQPVDPELAEKLRPLLDKMMRGATSVEVRELELAEASEHAKACPEDHEPHLQHLRDLVDNARRDHAAATASQPDEVGDAVQQNTTDPAHNDSTCPGGC